MATRQVGAHRISHGLQSCGECMQGAIISCAGPACANESKSIDLEEGDHMSLFVAS